MSAVTRRRDSGSIPPLANGDRLSAEEFMRRYEAMPDVKKAELVEGVVFMGSPVSADDHAIPHQLVSTWLGVFAAPRPELEAGDNATVLFDPEDIVQPDLYLRRTTSGTSSKGTYIAGPPELIIEVSATTASIDLHKKKRLYERSGVIEYVVWRTRDARVDWFCLEDGAYITLLPDDAGVIESRAFPGLRMDVAALLAGDLVGVLAAIGVTGL